MFITIGLICFASIVAHIAIFVHTHNFALVSPVQITPVDTQFHSPIPTNWKPQVTPSPTMTPSPTPTATPYKKEVKKYNSSAPLKDKEIAAMIKSFDWDYSVAIRLAKSENFWNLTHSFDCERTNTNSGGSTDYGLYQINDVYQGFRVKAMGYTMEDMKDCKKNAEVAYAIYKSWSGWTAWSAFKNGSYLTHTEDVY